MRKSEFQLEVIIQVREMRYAQKLSQAEFAYRMDVSYGLIGNIESYKFPHKYTLKQLVKAGEILDYDYKGFFLTDEELKLPTKAMYELLITKILEYDG